MWQTSQTISKRGPNADIAARYENFPPAWKSVYLIAFRIRLYILNNGIANRALFRSIIEKMV